MLLHILVMFISKVQQINLGGANTILSKVLLNPVKSGQFVVLATKQKAEMEISFEKQKITYMYISHSSTYLLSSTIHLTRNREILIVEF